MLITIQEINKTIDMNNKNDMLEKMKMTPAEYVHYVFGSNRAVAIIVDRDPSSVSRWKSHSMRGGCNGAIPRIAQQKILEYAKKHKLDLNASDLIYGREVRVDNTKRLPV